MPVAIKIGLNPFTFMQESRVFMKLLIIGGAGMLGRVIAQQAVDRGYTVRVLDLQAVKDLAFESVIGDITQYEDVLNACADVDTVIHTASLVNVELGKPPILHEINVTGTKNVIRACQEQGVQKLIYTSSIDVVFDGTPIINGDETLPYPRKHLDYYGETKMQAEKLVLDANNKQGLAVAVIRSAGIYGPGDRHRFPAVISNTLSGKFIRIGNGGAKFSHVYVENMAHAHILLAEKLSLESVCAGEVYFISDYEASNFFDFFIPYLKALELDYQVQVIPAGLANVIAHLLEWRYKLLKSDATRKVQLSPYTVASVARDFWFNHDKATRDFAYQPIISEEEAFQRTLNWLKNEWIPQYQGNQGQRNV